MSLDTKKLEKLFELKQKGAISEEEYLNLRKKLLNEPIQGAQSEPKIEVSNNTREVSKLHDIETHKSGRTSIPIFAIISWSVAILVILSGAVYYWYNKRLETQSFLESIDQQKRLNLVNWKKLLIGGELQVEYNAGDDVVQKRRNVKLYFKFKENKIVGYNSNSNEFNIQYFDTPFGSAVINGVYHSQMSDMRLLNIVNVDDKLLLATPLQTSLNSINNGEPFDIKLLINIPTFTLNNDSRYAGTITIIDHVTDTDEKGNWDGHSMKLSYDDYPATFVAFINNSTEAPKTENVNTEYLGVYNLITDSTQKASGQILLNSSGNKYSAACTLGSSKTYLKDVKISMGKISFILEDEYYYSGTITKNTKGEFEIEVSSTIDKMKFVRNTKKETDDETIDFSNYMGTYKGTVDNKELIVVFEDLYEAGEFTGYYEIGEKKGRLSGIIQPDNNGFKITLKEILENTPISFLTLKLDNTYKATGEWKSDNGKISKSVSIRLIGK